uniref:HMG box domain-containing protein n=1 Tax=Ailuropoda melanoleuca TaxID=9646 RepID=A0A7N5KBA6_AILME
MVSRFSYLLFLFQKRKGGWPKGKKRKPPRDISVPRAPVTGYVIFLNEQRSQLRARHPDLPFTEITKILAAQWAQLSQEKKQVSPFLRRTRRKWPPLPTASIRGCSPPPAHLFTQEPQGTFWKAGMNCLSPHPLKEMLVLPCFWLPPFSKLG